MPIYAFQCAECGHDFDRLQKLSDPDPTVCPSCGAEAVKRQVTAPSFRLAGGGWYETDFKKSGDKKRNLAESASTSASTSAGSPPSSGGGDAKPAATPKAEPKPAS
jgi:putative FmdB family regulatory protein